jgi:hypothetical protein
MQTLFIFLNLEQSSQLLRILLITCNFSFTSLWGIQSLQHGIPSVVGAAKPGEDSSVTTADGDKNSNTQKMKDLSRTIIDHGKKMVFVAQMKCNQHEKDCNEPEKDRSYAMQAEIRASLCSLGAEKRQMTIQMQAEKVKKIRQWKQSTRMGLLRSQKRRSRRFHF